MVDRATFQAELDAVRVREKAHTREGDAIAAARRRLPMVAVDGTTQLIGERGRVTLLDAFEGRRLLIAYYFMWHAGQPAPDQCEGCTLYTSQVRELLMFIRATLPLPCCARAHSKRAPGIATSWDGSCPGIRPQDSSNTRLVGRRCGLMHLVCYLRQGSDVFETYWTGCAASRRWITTIGCSTLPSTAGRSRGRTRHLAGRNSGARRSAISSRWTSNCRNGPREGGTFRRLASDRALTSVARIRLRLSMSPREFFEHGLSGCKSRISKRQTA